MLYGCDVAGNSEGEKFVAKLAALTQADVAASNDKTGASALSGDWVLEFTTGEISSSLAFNDQVITDYSEVMAAFTEAFDSDPTGGSPVTSFSRTLDSVQFNFTFTANGDGGDMTHETQFGEANGPSINVGSATFNTGTTELITIARNDASDFIFTSIFINNSAGTTVTVGGYNNGALVGSTQAMATASSGTMNFAGITVDEIRVTSTDFLNVNIDSFSGDTSLPNNAPTIGGASAGQATTDTTTVSPFSALTIADADGDNVTTTVTLDTNAKGVFTPASLTASGFTGTGPYTLASTTAANAQTAIRQLVFDPTNNRVAVGSTETTTFTVGVNDGATTTNDNVTTVVSTSINDAPSLSAGGSLTAVNEDTASPIGATVSTLLNTVFTDADPTSSMAGIAVSADASVTGVEGDWQYTTDGSTWYDIGTVSTVSALLLPSSASLRFVPFTNYNGTPGGLTAYAVDNSSATTFTSGATRQAFDTTADDATSKVSVAGVSVGTSVTAVNDDPAIASLPTSITVTEDTAGNVDLSAATLTDVDSTSGLITLTIAAGLGTMTATSAGSVTVGGSGTGTLTLSGTVTNIDAYLNTAANIQYTSASNISGTAATTLTLTANDGGNIGSGGGGNVALGMVNIDITGVGDTPSVTGATTSEDTQSTSGLVISRNVNDSTEVTHFKITSISNGTLYKNDGVTAIANNEFITFSEGNAGLKFTPTANSTTSGSFNIQAGTDGVGGELSAGSATATITVTAVGDTPSVTNTTTSEDIQSTTGLVISRNAVDGAEVTHFKVTSIANGTLYKNDGTTAIANNDFITFAEGNAGLKFTPDANSTTSGTFDIQAGIDGVGGGLSAGSATATISITPVNDAPTLTNLSGDSVNFTIGGSGVVLDASGNATLADIDSTDFSGGNVTVSIIANAQTGEDVLKIGTVAAIATSGSNVTHTDGFTIGSFVGGTAGANLVITLNANATVARVRDLLSALQYVDSDAGTVNTLARTVRITVNDGDGGSPTSANQDVTVNLVRAPILDLDGNNSSGNTIGGYNATFTEDGGAVAVADVDPTIMDDGSTYTSLKATLIARPDGDGVESLSSTTVNGATIGGDTVVVSSYNSATGELIFTAAGGDGDGFLDSTTMLALMSSVQYNNTSQNPNTTSRNIEFVAVDSTALTGPTSTAVITVNRNNDSMVGTVAITGTPTEHLDLAADVTGLTDADGLGAFSYQWKRSGSDISGATSATYTLVRADVGETMTVVATQTDDGGTLETSTSAPTAAVAGDYDNDSLIDGVDPDGDGDGMPDAWETANGLDPFNDADAAGDIDGDGLTNLFEYDNSKDPTLDDNPPTVTAPATVNVDATGLFTPVTLGTATASDVKDGSLTPTSDATPYYQPGVHTVTWSATDAAGNTGTATQTVNVTPLVGLSKDQVSAEGATATFDVILNGSAVTYPVTVPYTLSGTALTDGSSDHDLVDGSVDITSPNLSTTISVNIVDDGAGEGSETMVVTLGTPTNAVVGAKSTHTMTINEGNVAPDVSLEADQGSGATRLIEQAGGNVVVTATVTDPNATDTHTYDWSATDNALVDTDGLDNTFTFDPTTEGAFVLSVTVTDNGTGALTSRDEIIVRVEATLPTLDTSDTDGDLIDDITEGLGDSDGDGVPDYLDSANLPSNTLQEKRSVSNEFVMETEPGLRMQLGQVAFRAGGNKASVNDDDIASHANNGAGAQADSEFSYNGGVFDFSIGGLPVAGQSVSLVIPQLSAIPANAVYRKLLPGGWMTFTEDANNSLASAAGAEGFCPPPGDTAYQAGLSQGHWCVQLTIEDGGPNDADGVVDNTVDDPGGVAVVLAVTPTPTPVDTEVEVKVSSGGGSFSPLWLSLLGLFAVPRILAARKKGVKHETL